jgi:hypothetical protein
MSMGLVTGDPNSNMVIEGQVIEAQEVQALVTQDQEADQK